MMTPDEIAFGIVSSHTGISCALDKDRERLVERIAAALAAERAARERMCVNCGKVVDADKVKRGDSLPECEADVDGVRLSACTFDMTPDEAWQHWRKVAHDERAAREQAEHDFKNFHRMLCERFGYGHDEKDWKRDQVSLMEAIAARAEKAEAALREIEPMLPGIVSLRSRAEMAEELRDLYSAAATAAEARAEKAEAERDEARQEAFNLRAKCGGCIKFDERVDLENRARAAALREAADTARRMHNEYAANAILELIDKQSQEGE